MRLQLKMCPKSRKIGLRFAAKGFGVAVACGVLGRASMAHAQVAEIETAHTLYHEAPTRSNMTVYTPGVDVSVTPADWITVRGGYEADVVSGASVATKAGPAYQAVNPGVDVVTTASVHDFRQAPRGGLTFRKGDVAFTTSYTYGTENDYKSHAIFVGARTDAYGHNTQFEISYARNFDLVCDRVQAVNDTAPRFRALEDSSGCFTGKDPLRTRHTLSIDGLQASWTQAWTPVFATQLIYTAQLLDGFQSNPYRSVIVAEGLKAEEHHPAVRARQALALRLNYYVRAVKLAVRLTGRVYRDTWDITSGTGELELERYLVSGLRLGLHGRFYKQSGAVFWSDDYTGGDRPLGPKGQYFTGDRELSPFWSAGLGLRVAYAIHPTSGDDGRARLLGLFESAKLGASADAIQFSYDEYTLAGMPIQNARAYILGLTAGAAF